MTQWLADYPMAQQYKQMFLIQYKNFGITNLMLQQINVTITSC